jgi:glycosyltransferase involved in cell wall biosynthesis
VSESSLDNLAVYVVTNFLGGGNDRGQKLFLLRPLFNKMVSVSSGGHLANDEVLQAKRLPNPTGLLRLLGLNALKRTLDRFLFFPSRDVLFVWAVRRKLRNAIARDLAAGKRVCLLIAVPPHALCTIGLYIKKRFPQVYWVLDWQDLWSYDENYFLQAPKPYRNRLRRLERTILETTDMNVMTNAYAKDVLKKHYAVPAQRLQHIHHHYHAGDLRGHPTASINGGLPAKTDGVIRIGFLGTLFKPPRVPGRDLVETIVQIRQSGVDVELHVHGALPTEMAAETERLRKVGVVLHGRTHHGESLQLLTRYDFLLLFLADFPNCKAVMSIKLPHYLLVGKPILAIVPAPSAIADIVNDTGAGFVIPVNGDWRQGLKSTLLASTKEPLRPPRNDVAIEQFSWEQLSRKWTEVIGRAADGKSETGRTDRASNPLSRDVPEDAVEQQETSLGRTTGKRHVAKPH